MATPKPGEIRCPTCHRSTPPAAYCTQCGSPIPTDARARPRGMDRDELQERIRARRSGGEPYRRGGLADEAAFERFEPEPEDANARREDRREEPREDLFDDAAHRREPATSTPPPAPAAPPDLTREQDDWTTSIPPAAAAAASGPSTAPEPGAATPAEPEAQPAYAEPAAATADDPFADEPYADDRGYDPYDESGGYPYEYDSWEERRARRNGTGAFAIMGFLALGVLALLGGAVLAGVFGGDPGDGVARESGSPSVEASIASTPTPEPSLAPSEPPSSAEASAIPTGEPVVFPDGARFEVQMCASSEMDFNGCAQRAEFVSGGSFIAWVGFSGASGSDTLILVLRENGAAVADSDFQLGGAPFNCSANCTGYARQAFAGLAPGEYTLEVLRNGEMAHAITIGVD